MKFKNAIAAMIANLDEEQQHRIMGGFDTANRLLAGESFPLSEVGGQLLDVTSHLCGMLYTQAQVIAFLKEHHPRVCASLDRFVAEQKQMAMEDDDA